MAKTGPQQYPQAATTAWYGKKYPGSDMETNVICWHTTESTSLPSYSGGSDAPTLTALPNFKAERFDWFQHFEFDTSARALVNATGGVETNTLNVGQVEIVGTCDPATHAKWTKAGIPHLYTPELPDWAIRDLAAFARWAHDQHGVPLTSGLTFKAYPASGSGAGVRMTAAQWKKFKGHCGHQHVPENDHGDPGQLPMAAILAAATSTTTPAPTTPQEDPMAGITPEQIYDAVWRTDRMTPPTGAETKTNPHWAAESVLREAANQSRAVRAALTAQAATITELARAVADRTADIDAEALISRITTAINNITIRLDSTPEA